MLDLGCGAGEVDEHPVRSDAHGEPVGPELRVMESIKTALDPAGVFAPGRFVDGL